MKIYPQFKLKNSLVLAAFLGLTVVFQACKMNNDVPSADVSALTIINASPNSNGLDFYIDNQKLNPTPFNFPLRMPYQRVYSGTRVAKVTTSTNSTTLLSGNIALQPNEYHSLFIVGKVEALEFFLVRDSLTFPAAGKTKVRFGNLSPDASGVTLEIVGDTSQFKSQNYKMFSTFKTIKPGKFTLNLKNASTNAVLATTANVEFLPDKVYTVWAKGLTASSVDAQKLGIHIINHDN